MSCVVRIENRFETITRGSKVGNVRTLNFELLFLQQIYTNPRQSQWKRISLLMSHLQNSGAPISHGSTVPEKNLLVSNKDGDAWCQRYLVTDITDIKKVHLPVANHNFTRHCCQKIRIFHFYNSSEMLQDWAVFDGFTYFWNGISSLSQPKIRISWICEKYSPKIRR